MEATMPGDVYAQMFGDVAMVVENRGTRWQRRLISSPYVEKGKWVIIAAGAMVRGRAGGALLKRIMLLSCCFIYEYLVVVETIVAVVILVELAAQVLRHVTYKVKPNAGVDRHLEQTVSDHPASDVQLPALVRRKSFGAGATAQLGSSVVVEFPNNERSLAIPTSWHDKNGHGQPIPSKGLTDIQGPVLMHFKLPIYSCAYLTFWNNIVVTLEQPSWRLRRRQGEQQFFHLQMRMAIKLSKGSLHCKCRAHSVGKRHFRCAQVNGQLKVHKSSFHEGRSCSDKLFYVNNKLLIMLSHTIGKQLNFKFESRVEQIGAPSKCHIMQYYGNCSLAWSASSFKQQSTLELLPSTFINNENVLKGSSPGDGASAGHIFTPIGILNYFNTRKKASPFSFNLGREATYILEDNMVNLDSEQISTAMSSSVTSHLSKSSKNLPLLFDNM